MYNTLPALIPPSSRTPWLCCYDQNVLYVYVVYFMCIVLVNFNLATGTYHVSVIKIKNNLGSKNWSCLWIPEQDTSIQFEVKECSNP